jgi:RNA polymerase sigma factor (sigma-70 family)
MRTVTKLPVTAPHAAGGAARAAGARRRGAAVARLVERAAAGDQRAWNELVDQFDGLVWSVARAHRLNDADAADVSQITWQRLVEHLDRLHDPARVGAWLATTARRQCFLQLRSAARVVPHGDELPAPVGDAPPPDAELLTGERDRALWAVVERLPARDQKLLRMLVAEPPHTYAEIGAALDMPIGSIGPTRARALERLRRELESEGLLEPE